MAKERATLKNKIATKQPDKGGRPPTYDPKIHPQVAKALCAKGATIVELAAAFDVAISTIWEWKASKPDFSSRARWVARKRMIASSAACSSAPLVTPTIASRFFAGRLRQAGLCAIQRDVPPDPRDRCHEAMAS